jgi:hypothetical protein
LIQKKPQTSGGTLIALIKTWDMGDKPVRVLFYPMEFASTACGRTQVTTITSRERS